MATGDLIRNSAGRLLHVGGRLLYDDGMTEPGWQIFDPVANWQVEWEDEWVSSGLATLCQERHQKFIGLYPAAWSTNYYMFTNDLTDGFHTGRNSQGTLLMAFVSYVMRAWRFNISSVANILDAKIIYYGLGTLARNKLNGTVSTVASLPVSNPYYPNWCTTFSQGLLSPAYPIMAVNGYDHLIDGLTATNNTLAVNPNTTLWRDQFTMMPYDAPVFNANAVVEYQLPSSAVGQINRFKSNLIATVAASMQVPHFTNINYYTCSTYNRIALKLKVQ